MIWAPDTEADIDRIREFNTKKFGIDIAEAIEDFLIDTGNALRPGDGRPWRELAVRKVQTHHPARRRRLSYQYLLFIRLAGADTEILAVYHVREDWRELVPARV